MLNRRTFVQTMGAGAVGVLGGLSSDLSAQTPTSAQAPARLAGTAATSAVRIGGNENPYGPSPKAIEAIATVSPGANRYPGVLIGGLITAVAAKFSVPEDMILLSGGSGDLINAIVSAYSGKGKVMLTGLPSYEQPTRTTQRIGGRVVEVGLTGDLKLDLPAMAAKVVGTDLVYICNPNNPTSTALPAAEVAAFIESTVAASPSTHILVDEAYIDYADLKGVDTVAPLARKHPQVIVIRTMSKAHGMAGMRVGYAIAQPKTLAEIREYHSGSGLSSMSLAAATASLKDVANIAKQQELNRKVRSYTTDAFTAAGYVVAASDANFIFVNIKRDSRVFQEACRVKGVQVGRAFPPMTTWARISIGTQEEMTRSVPVFMSVLGAPPTQTAMNLDHLDALPSELMV